jgi:D-threonate/D-erythronate kinase
MSIECLLIADDLTGACDAAVHFARRGLSTIVPLVPGAPGARVAAISTDSRDLPPEEIRRAIANAAAEYPAASLIFKKIDSTLRGSPGLEIAAALEAFDCEEAVVCPAFPKLHRVVESGYLRVTNDPGFAPLDVAARLQGARVVCVDAASDEDLDRIAAVLLPRGRRVLWAGSGGLASALARCLGESCLPPPVRTGRVLFCIGSDHPVTLAQVNALSAARPQHEILRVPRGKPFDPPARPAALVLSGGDTASLVCRAIGVHYIELCDEIVPGVPRGILRGGMFDGVSVVTKSGGFGEPDALIRVADFFACPNQP